MRVFLTKLELATTVGKELLDLAVRITTDGKLDLVEIKELRGWLRQNIHNQSIAAIAYLHDIMTRITADGVIDRDELLELHVAVERVIPTSLRTPVLQARKKRETSRHDKLRERRRVEKEKEKEAQRTLRAEEYALRMRLRHSFAKVVGVTFPNDDGSERQKILKRCKVGDRLLLEHDPNNEYSSMAIDVLRTNGQQVGHAPEYLAERIISELADGCGAVGVVTSITGGTWTKPTRGLNFAAVFVAKDVSNIDLGEYIDEVLATS